jgi:hypothetical protein
VTSTFTLFLSIFFALFAIRARSDWRGLNDEDIFNEEVFDEDSCRYKRYLTVHNWKIYNNNFSVNEAKARKLKVAHFLFVLGLLQLLPIILVIALYAYITKGGG